MRTISVRDLQKGIRRSVRLSQRERVVVTRNGEPAAILIGVEGEDWETLALQTSRSFWRMIEARRKEPTIPLREALKRYRVRSGRRGRR